MVDVPSRTVRIATRECDDHELARRRNDNRGSESLSLLGRAVLARHAVRSPGFDWCVRNRCRIGYHAAAAGLHDHVGHGPQFAAAAAASSCLSRRYIERTQIKDAPIFIIGHWRIGHDAAARAAGARRALHVSHDLRVPGAESLSDQRLARDQAQVSAAQAAADGQHGDRLGPAAGRRVRAVQHGPAVAVSDDGLSQRAAADIAST